MKSETVFREGGSVMIFRWKSPVIRILFLFCIAILQSCESSRQSARLEPGGQPVRLEGFDSSPHWNEQIKSYVFNPGVKIHINAPAPERLNPALPTRVIFFALPNGNSTAWTIGRKMEEGLDWHYDIQHIGAQTRLLRQWIHDENIVTAYLEAEGKSWPGWKKVHPDYRERIPAVIRSVTESLGLGPVRIDLSGHSGGGSFVFGYIDSVDPIPREVERIVFLDSNYGYDDESGHGDKLIAWLKDDPDHFLVVLAYDDREITYEGKRVVGPTGGTWRATHRMLDRFIKDYPLDRSERGDRICYRIPNRQAEFNLHKNPKNEILHTVLVERNGFLYSSVYGARYAKKAEFYGDRQYGDWIQAE